MVGDAVNHFHQPEQHENLRRQRNERQQRMIVVLLVQQGLLLADGFASPKYFTLMRLSSGMILTMTMLFHWHQSDSGMRTILMIT